MSGAGHDQPWLDALPDPTVGLDDAGCLQWANRAAMELFGWEFEERRGRSALELLHPEDVGFALLSLESVQHKVVGTPIEVRLQTRSGWRLVEVVGANRLGVDGIDCLILTMRDLTQRRRWELGRGDDAVFRSVVHNSASLLMLTGPDGGIRTVSGAVTRLLGLDPEQLEGRPLLDLARPDDRPRLADAMTACRRGDAVTIEVSLSDIRGRPVPFELTLADLVDDPTVSGLVVSGHNITKLRLAQRALAELALKDPLTMLPNRTVVDDTLEAALSQGIRVSVAFVDLDNFKLLNDRFGHLIGDEVLREVANRLVAAIRPTDVVARYGGDEFVVIAETGPRGAELLAERLLSAVCRPLDAAGVELEVSASIGVVHSRPGDRPADVLGRADRCMYSSKTARRVPTALKVVGSD